MMFKATSINVRHLSVTIGENEERGKKKKKGRKKKHQQ